MHLYFAQLPLQFSILQLTVGQTGRSFNPCCGRYFSSLSCQFRQTTTPFGGKVKRMSLQDFDWVKFPDPLPLDRRAFAAGVSPKNKKAHLHNRDEPTTSVQTPLDQVVSLRQPGCPRGIRGFASPDCSGFALIEVGTMTEDSDRFPEWSEHGDSQLQNPVLAISMPAVKVKAEPIISWPYLSNHGMGSS